MLSIRKSADHVAVILKHQLEAHEIDVINRRKVLLDCSNLMLDEITPVVSSRPLHACATDRAPVKVVIAAEVLEMVLHFPDQPRKCLMIHIITKALLDLLQKIDGKLPIDRCIITLSSSRDKVADDIKKRLRVWK